MVKLCSPFMLSGVVDSSFKRSGRGTSHEIEAHKTHYVWESKISSSTPTRPSCHLRCALFPSARFFEARDDDVLNVFSTLQGRNKACYCILRSLACNPLL